MYLHVHRFNIIIFANVIVLNGNKVCALSDVNCIPAILRSLTDSLGLFVARQLSWNVSGQPTMQLVPSPSYPLSRPL